ncbi:MAG: ATP-binding cassette domain-containing protein [Spirochaetes bacterium]|nr:ATP-binding cassette domain-containing protein [Spirochaetota bacterium]
MNPVIEFHQVSLIRQGIPVLSDITFFLNHKENLVVLGRNGAGKSFLLRLISAEEYPTTGTVKILGRTFGQSNLCELKKHIKVVSDLMQANYPDIPVHQVISSGVFSTIGLYEKITFDQRQLVNKLANWLELEHLLDHSFSKISHGEQRKVLIARALVSEPQILILDEPCTGLDFIAREQFLHTIQEIINKGIQIIMVTHHPEEIISAFDKILLIKKGRVFAQGNRQEIFTKSLLTDFFEHPLTVTENNKRFWLTV